MQYPEAERRGLLAYGAAPALNRAAVSRYTLGERILADEILAPFRAERFARIWSDLVALALPALGIEVRKGASTGRSKLGGLPDLPPGTDWPRRGKKPLVFICQLDLGEVNRHLRDAALPSAGLLSFFYEADVWTAGSSPEDRGAWRILLLDGTLSPQEPPPAAPPAVPSGYQPATWGFKEVGVVLTPRISLPYTDHALLQRFHLSREDEDAYGALLDELRKAHGPPNLRNGHNLRDLTQLLGYPAEIQGDPFKTSQLASNGMNPRTERDWASEEVDRLLQLRANWRLLLQVDSISEIGMDWADSGLLYYCMQDEDMQARDWNRSWLVMDSL